MRTYLDTVFQKKRVEIEKRIYISRAKLANSNCRRSVRTIRKRSARPYPEDILSLRGLASVLIARFWNCTRPTNPEIAFPLPINDQLRFLFLCRTKKWTRLELQLNLMSAIRIHYCHSMKTTSISYMLERNSKSLGKRDCFGSPNNGETDSFSILRFLFNIQFAERRFTRMSNIISSL